MPVLNVGSPYVYNNSLYLLNHVEGNVAYIANIFGDIIRADVKELIPTTFDQIDVWFMKIENNIVGPNIFVTNREIELWNEKIAENKDGKAIKSYY